MSSTAHPAIRSAIWNGRGCHLLGGAVLYEWVAEVPNPRCSGACCACRAGCEVTVLLSPRPLPRLTHEARPPAPSRSKLVGRVLMPDMQLMVQALTAVRFSCLYDKGPIANLLWRRELLLPCAVSTFASASSPPRSPSGLTPSANRMGTGATRHRKRGDSTCCPTAHRRSVHGAPASHPTAAPALTRSSPRPRP